MTSSSRSDGPEAPEKTSPEDAGTGAPGLAGTAPGAADTAGTGERNRLEAAAAALAATGRAAGSGGTTGSGATPVASGVSSSTSGSVVQPGATPVPTPGSDPYLGRVLDGRYRIDRRLGTGGMGAVFAGEHLALRKRVAIKVIKKDLAGNDDVAARFAREALASARLDHPNVATALDSGTLEEGGAYLVMQLVRGRSLRDLLGERGPLPWTDVCEVGAQVADALAAAHREGIVHRDLKPENLLAEDRDDGALHVRVVDFGIARMSLPSDGPDRVPRKALAQTLTRAGTVVGTPGYMAPEQAMGDAVDERTDIYALGVILWELATGRDPFDRRGREVASLIRAQLTTPPDPPDPNRLPPPLEGVLRGMLQPDRAHRPSDAAEIRDACRQLLGMGPLTGDALPVVAGGPASTGGPASSHPAPELAGPRPSGAPSFIDSLPPPPRLSPPLVAGAATIAFVVLVGAGIGVARWLGGPTPARSAVATASPPGNRTDPEPGKAAKANEDDGEDGARAAADDEPQELRLDPSLPPILRARITEMLDGERWIDREQAAEWIAAQEGELADQIPDWVRAVAAFELARGCRERERAIDAVLRAADPRALPALERIARAPTTGCGDDGDQDCHGCIRSPLDRAVRALRATPR